jgi:hypothetical protein
MFFMCSTDLDYEDETVDDRGMATDIISVAPDVVWSSRFVLLFRNNMIVLCDFRRVLMP